MSYGDLLGDVEAQSEPGFRTFRPAWASSNISDPPLAASHSSTTTSSVVCGASEVVREKGIRRDVLSWASEAKTGRRVKAAPKSQFSFPA